MTGKAIDRICAVYSQVFAAAVQAGHSYEVCKGLARAAVDDLTNYVIETGRSANRGEDAE